MKRTTILGVILALILISMSFTSAVTTQEEPEYYEVTRYNMRGFTYDTETIQVSHEDAMAMKQELEQLESLPIDASEMNSRRKDVFLQYDLLSVDDVNRRSNWDNKHEHRMFNNLERQDTTGSYLLLFSGIEGTIGPSFINLLNCIIIAPIFWSIAKGADLRISYVFDGVTIETDNWVNLLLIALTGTILILPFFSPTGYINGKVPLGFIETYEY